MKAVLNNGDNVDRLDITLGIVGQNRHQNSRKEVTRGQGICFDVAGFNLDEHYWDVETRPVLSLVRCVKTDTFSAKPKI